MMFGVKANGGSNPSTTAGLGGRVRARGGGGGGFLCRVCSREVWVGTVFLHLPFVMRCIKCLNQTTSTFRGVPYLLIGESVINERIWSLLGMIVPEQAGGGRLLERDL